LRLFTGTGFSKTALDNAITRLAMTAGVSARDAWLGNGDTLKGWIASRWR